jgi:hypothetical protein
MKHVLTKTSTLILATAVLLIASASAFAQATITIVKNDSPGVGFNDTTPATPVGGNNGTTVGEQRLIVFQTAASIWGAALNSGPTITVSASWSSTMPCAATSGTLGSAGNSGSIWRDFSGARPGFWYGNALANAISNTDRNGATQELNATFNSQVGVGTCLTGAHWYYGLDNNHGTDGIDLMSVVLHEFGHGLGFQTYTNTSTGAEAGSQQGGFFPSIFDNFLFDDTTSKTWAQMTDSERVASATRYGFLLWNGPQVTTDAPKGVLSSVPRLRISSPPQIAANYQIGQAEFGPLTGSSTPAPVIQTIPNDACTALSNSLTGKIALIDRGTCSFVNKTKNAQNAGAIGVIIVDNVSNSTPPGMGGADNTITIATVSVTQAAGNAIKAQLGGGVTAAILSDRRAFMYTPTTVSSGSSVSHWDTALTPNQLMEPFISDDLTHSVRTPQDLTLSLFRDIGWPINVNVAPAILVQPGTNVAATVDSVTFVRDPFTVTTPNNFSADGRRRLVIFVTPVLTTSPLSVTANGIPLPIEAWGTFNDLAGTSYIIVRLPDLQPTDYALRVVAPVPSTNSPTITISP